MTDDLLLFETTRAVIKAEEALLAAGVAHRVIPVPKEIAADCGMAIACPAGTGESAFARVDAAGIAARLHIAPAPPRSAFDLLTTVDQGGCSAKLPAKQLAQITAALPRPAHPDLLVGFDACDDAGVFRLTDEIALIETTDFFPPICSDPFEFGQIAAANAMSDVYAMGGRVLTCMNLAMFPAAGIPLEILGEILRGGAEKVAEAGGLLVGGHTIADSPPKYGLAVTGIVHPSRVIGNRGARPGDRLLLTKPLGTGTLVAGSRAGLARAEDHRAALESMKRLNRAAAEIMQARGATAATDVTGFGLIGHALHIAEGSGVTLRIAASALPALPGALDLLDAGCIPGGAFRNLDYAEARCAFSPALPYARKMLALDPQTSGGILMCLPADEVDAALAALIETGDPAAAVIGEVLPRGDAAIRLV